MNHYPEYESIGAQMAQVCIIIGVMFGHRPICAVSLRLVKKSRVPDELRVARILRFPLQLGLFVELMKSMRDKRPVDELSVEELERVLAIKRREARQQQLERMKRTGRVIEPILNGQPRAVKAAVSKSSETAAPQKSPDVRARADMPHFEDDPEAILPDIPEENDETWKNFVNGVLFMIEVTAVIGLAFIGYQMFMAIGTLEDETRDAQAITNATRVAAIPTLEPTPMLRLDQIVLPGGHIRDEETGEGQFNFAEIPSHLQAAVAAQVFPPKIDRPPKTIETALSINIPRLNKEETIVQGTDWEALRQGVGQVQNGYTPDDAIGNVVLAAHNDIYGEIFRELDQLQVGDRFDIRTQTRVYTYMVTGTEVVDPDAVHVMDGKGEAMSTLISCYPYGQNTQRYIVYAKRQET